MRKPLLLPLLLLAASASAAPQVPDSTGLPGDGFSLQGALELFKNASDLEAFEHALNSTDSHVNNLDLDANGEVDYIHVRTQADGDARVIVLQAALAKEDLQDVAVIELEKTADAQAMVQIRGDDELYAENTIIEPAEEVKEGVKGKGGPAAPYAQMEVWVNVWMWPSVQWCYTPMWYEWNSPWYWGYYPPWYRPWRPIGWGHFWGFRRPYWGWYRPINFCRVERAHNLYWHRRSVSATVHGRTAAIRERNGRNGVRPGVNDRNRLEGPDRKVGIKPTQKAPAVRDKSPAPNKVRDRSPAPKAPHRNVAPKAPSKQPARSSPTKSPGGGGGRKR